ncbi:hypothetical protein ACFIOY_14550 [Bradyrhizobium sp. TZ2]
MKLNAMRGRIGKERAGEMTHQAVLDGGTPFELVRPGILAGHDPGGIVGEAIDEGGPAAVGGIRVDLLHKFLVRCCAHGGFLLICAADHRAHTPFFQSIMNRYIFIP